ncbi:hypothetical protein PR002_g27977 [Phytophthora rubi]|uniref:Uncharacterized protein n=2 Tax=Phytophthora rubi TaxID=129364 RepID=A0A6A3HEU2_9STRA|nr:hypothetical protein PR002_g27977 [Phytophthora rubi]
MSPSSREGSRKHEWPTFSGNREEFDGFSQLLVFSLSGDGKLGYIAVSDYNPTKPYTFQGREYPPVVNLQGKDSGPDSATPRASVTPRSGDNDDDEEEDDGGDGNTNAGGKKKKRKGKKKTSPSDLVADGEEAAQLLKRMETEKAGVCYILVSSLPVNYRKLVQGLVCPHAMWQAIEGHFGTRDPTDYASSYTDARHHVDKRRMQVVSGPVGTVVLTMVTEDVKTMVVTVNRGVNLLVTDHPILNTAVGHVGTGMDVQIPRIITSHVGLVTDLHPQFVTNASMAIQHQDMMIVDTIYNIMPDRHSSTVLPDRHHSTATPDRHNSSETNKAHPSGLVINVDHHPDGAIRHLVDHETSLRRAGVDAHHREAALAHVSALIIRPLITRNGRFEDDHKDFPGVSKAYAFGYELANIPAHFSLLKTTK